MPSRKDHATRSHVPLLPAERLVAVLLDGAGDAHFKVATAALQAMAAGLGGASSRVFEPHLDRIMPLLFARVADAKEQIRQLVATTLAGLPQHHAPDAVLAAISKALQVNKGPRVRCAIMDHVSAAAVHPQQRVLMHGQGPALRQLVAGVLQLATDKNLEVRRAALRMAVAVCTAGQAQVVEEALSKLPHDAASTVHKALSAAIQAQDPGPSQQQQQRPTIMTAARGAGQAANGAPLPAVLGSRSRSSRLSLEGPLPSGRSSPGGAGSAAPGSDIEAAARSPAAAAVSQPGAAASQPAQSAAQQQVPVPCARQAQSGAPPPCLAAGAEEGSRQAALPAPCDVQPLPAGGNTAPSEVQATATSLRPPFAPLDGVMEGQLRRLLGRLQAGPASEVLQGLSRLVHVLPAAAWASHSNQVRGSAGQVATLCAVHTTDLGLEACRGMY